MRKYTAFLTKGLNYLLNYKGFDIFIDAETMVIISVHCMGSKIEHGRPFWVDTFERSSNEDQIFLDEEALDAQLKEGIKLEKEGWRYDQDTYSFNGYEYILDYEMDLDSNLNIWYEEECLGNVADKNKKFLVTYSKNTSLYNHDPVRPGYFITKTFKAPITQRSRWDIKTIPYGGGEWGIEVCDLQGDLITSFSGSNGTREPSDDLWAQFDAWVASLPE